MFLIVKNLAVAALCLIISACAAPQILKNYASQEVHQNRALALFLDGTANNDLTRTHVRQLFELVSARNRPDIVTYYNDGVGGAIYERTGAIATLGTVAARGISRDIRQAFRFLATHYQTYSAAVLTDISSSKAKAEKAREQVDLDCKSQRNTGLNDTVYLFGFSRGAFTARSLIGLVNWYGGIPDFGYCNRSAFRIHKSATIEIYNLYRQFGRNNCHEIGVGHPYANPGPQCHELRRKLKNLRRRFPQRKIRFHFVGLWDTVRTVGREALLCVRENRGSAIREQHDFHRGEDFRNTEIVLHAVSLDEKRDCYNHVPLKITETGYQAPEAALEVWFRGDHSDVGGGHVAHKGLSGVTMNWMIDHLLAAQDVLSQETPRFTAILPSDLPADFVYENPCDGYGDLSGNGIFKLMGIAERQPAENAEMDINLGEDFKRRWKERFNLEKCQFERPF